MILADNGSPWYVTGAPDPRWNDDVLHALDADHTARTSRSSTRAGWSTARSRGLRRHVAHCRPATGIMEP